MATQTVTRQVGREQKPGYIGKRVLRFEDLRLANGEGTFVDDLPTPPNLHYAAIVRSPHARAKIQKIDTEEALKLPGVITVLTGQDIKDEVDPFPTAIRSAVKYFPLAITKVSFVGEPVAVVVAKDRFTAEDAAELVGVDYDILPAVVDPAESVKPDSPVIHEENGNNIMWQRSYRFGDPAGQFQRADKVVGVSIKVGGFSTPPLETYGIVASYDSASGILTEWCNFQGPFTFYYMTARALRLTEDRFRLVVPKDIGGGFGDKTGMFHYLCLIGVVSKMAKVPVKWIETRTEHFIGSTRAAGRIATFEMALDREGNMLALRADITDDVGAYARSPEPGHILRQLGNFVGPYKIQHVAIEGRCVVTNTVPTSPIRGFGGQHLYFALEKLVDKGARELGMDPAELRMKNFIDADSFPYKTPTGGIYDSGDYQRVMKRLLQMSDYEAAKAEAVKQRQKGKLVGVGVAVGIDPSVSNMGYLDTVIPPDERKGSDFLPKSGGQHTASVKMEPSGKAICHIDSCPQGQAHETVVAQIVSEVLGLKVDDVRVVAGIDTHKDVWSISAGTYSSRFASVGSSAVYSAAMKVRKKMLKVASVILGSPPDGIDVQEGKFFLRSDPSKSVSVRRIAGSVHWNPGAVAIDEDEGLYATSTYHIKTLKSPTPDDKTNSSGTYGFIADAITVEMDPETFETKISRYVSVHDSGTILNPGIVQQQCIGAANQGLEQATYQELAYDGQGQPLTTNFGDYFVNSAREAVDIEIGHEATMSPFTLLGSKGIGESNTETAPVAVALAIEDALRSYGVEIDELPITPEKIWKKITARRKEIQNT